jgi:hypothetical protein
MESKQKVRQGAFEMALTTLQARGINGSFKLRLLGRENHKGPGIDGVRFLTCQGFSIGLVVRRHGAESQCRALLTPRGQGVNMLAVWNQLTQNGKELIFDPEKQQKTVAGGNGNGNGTLGHLKLTAPITPATLPINPPEPESSQQSGVSVVSESDTPAGTSPASADEGERQGASTAVSDGRESLRGFADKPEHMDLLFETIASLKSPDGIIRSHRLSVKIIEALGLRTHPKAMIPFIGKLSKEGYLLHHGDGYVVSEKGTERLARIACASAPPPTHVPSRPSSVAPKSEASAPSPKPAALEKPDVAKSSTPQSSLIGELANAIRLAKELGAALKEMESISEEVSVAEERVRHSEGVLAVDRASLQSLEARRAKLSSVINSTEHRQARELIVSLRDLELD